MTQTRYDLSDALDALDPEYWFPLNYHAEQQRLMRSRTRFTFTAKGRRGGGTEIHKRKVWVKALTEGHTRPNYTILIVLPTLPQARETWWLDMKAMAPAGVLAGEPSESRMEMQLTNGARIKFLSAEHPQRIDGAKPDVIVLDEFGDMKGHVFDRHAAIAVDTVGRQGWVWCNGVPRGAHFARLFKMARDPKNPDMAAFNWPSEDILTEEAIADAKRRHDPLTYDAEYNARFQALKGRCYHQFVSGRNAVRELRYDPTRPLCFALDFGVDPSAAVVCQEQVWKGKPDRQLGIEAGQVFTAVLDEIFLEVSGSTHAVMDVFLHDWGGHKGVLEVYGDATGGNLHSSSGPNTNWRQVQTRLRDRFDASQIRERWNKNRVNPAVIDRVNTVNAMLRSASKQTRLIVDPEKCANLIDDFELTPRVPGGKGEPLKNPRDPETNRLTHLTDALGYLAEKKHGEHYGMRVIV